MKTSDWGRKFIERFEGLYLHTYDDGAGVPTIGYGHTTRGGGRKVTWGMKITPEEADAMLSDDLGRVERDVTKLVKVPLTQNQFDALVSFHFNTGGLGRSTLLQKLNSGDYASVPTELSKWNRGGGRVMAGLTTRRIEEGKLFNKKTIPATIPPVVVHKPTPDEPKFSWFEFILNILKFIFIKKS